jgi:hypothetical protein
MLDTPNLSLPAATMGHAAGDVLRSASQANVTEVNSRGIYLSTPAGQVIFLSYEPWRGPLTVNLSDAPAAGLGITVGQTARLSPEAIQLREDGVQVDLTHAHLWRPSQPPTTVRPLAQLDGALRQLAGPILKTWRGQGFAPLLPYILDLPSRPTVPISLQATIANLVLLKQNLLLQPLAANLPYVADLAGFGRGLTPSGDDFIHGLLLTFHRLPQRPVVQAQLGEWMAAVAATTAVRTTPLSASLPQAAAIGSADERLLLAFDGLVSGERPNQEILALLESYGVTSGIDALAGVALLIEAQLAQEAAGPAQPV